MFARKSLLTLITNFIYYLLYGITLVIAVNKFLPANFGYLKIATSLMSFFLFFSDLSFSILHSKLMAEEKEPQNDYFTTYFLIKITLSIISSVIIFIVIGIQINLKIISNNTIQIWVLFILYFTSLIQTFNLLFISTFSAKLQIAKKEVAFISSRIIGSFYVLFIIFVSNNFLLYVSGYLISECILLIFNLIFGKDFKMGRIRRDLIHKYFSLGALLILPSLILTFSINLGPFLFKSYFHDDDLLGVYEIITGFFIMIQLLEGTIRTLLIPNFSSLISQKKFHELKNSIKLFEKYVTILNSVIILGGIITGSFLIRRFLGEFYYQHGLVVFYGSLISLLNFGVFVPYSSLIFADARIKIYIYTVTFAFIFSLICWILFIPSLGIIAINLAGWIYWIPVSVFIRYYCYKYYKIGRMEKKLIFNYLILIIFGISSFFLSVFAYNKPLLLISFTIIIILLYLLILFIFKILTKKDFEFFREIINPKKMINYIKTEIKNNSEDQ